MIQRLALAAGGAATATIGYAVWLAWPWAGAFEWVTTAGVAIACAATWVFVASGRVAGRVAIAGLLLAAFLAVVVVDLAGVELFLDDPWPDARFSVFLLLLNALAIAGLARRWFAARWLAMALAAGGIATSGLNLAPWLALRYPFCWMHAVNIAGAALILINLAGADVRAAFRREGSAQVWSSPDRLMRALRWTVVAHFVAIPMLLVYAWVQPIVPTTADTAVGLAALLSVAVALTVARRVVGAVALVAGGIALVAQTVATVLGADTSDREVEIALYYALFWLPAAACALVTGARLVLPLARLMRR
jgi:hypothetical protein